mmetsp:Transcript_5574/g.9369  ORF Transcript_5574/g.9369 Transcript_5574/m.9369 type:complete len:89 (+) Transcript_5574:1500-1766(+)
MMRFGSAGCRAVVIVLRLIDAGSPGRSIVTIRSNIKARSRACSNVMRGSGTRRALGAVSVVGRVGNACSTVRMLIGSAPMNAAPVGRR